MRYRIGLGNVLVGATLMLLLLGWWVGPSSANGTGSEGDGPAFLVVSVSPTFSVPDVSLHCQSSSDGGCHDNRCGCKKRKRNDKKNCTCTLPQGSALVVLPVGTFVAGYDVRHTFLESLEGITSDSLAAVIAALGGIESLNGNQSTVFGAVDTTGPNSIHMLSPDPDAVPPQVQEAVFFASPELAAFDPADPAYPDTTVELANFIWLHQAPVSFSPELPPATLQEILDYLYRSNSTLDCTTCEAEADLFPHDPEPDNALITYTLSFDESGNVTIEGCTRVVIDVKPGNGDAADPINVGSEGVTPLVILSNRGERPDADGHPELITFFDPSDVDPSSVRLGAAKHHGESGQDWAGAAPVKSSFEDVNGDGVDDLVLHFDTQELADPDLGGLTEETTVVELHGETFSKGCIKGTDIVTIVPE